MSRKGKYGAFIGCGNLPKCRYTKSARKWIVIGCGAEKEACVARQQCAFSEECREIKGCGSLRVDFYTRFKPEN